MTVAQLAAHTGLAADTLRYYLRTGVLPEPPRTSAHARRFPAETLDRPAVVNGAQRLGSPVEPSRCVVTLRGLDDRSNLAESHSATRAAVVNARVTRVRPSALVWKF